MSDSERLREWAREYAQKIKLGTCDGALSVADIYTSRFHRGPHERKYSCVNWREQLTPVEDCQRCAYCGSSVHSTQHCARQVGEQPAQAEPPTGLKLGKCAGHPTWKPHVRRFDCGEWEQEPAPIGTSIHTMCSADIGRVPVVELPVPGPVEGMSAEQFLAKFPKSILMSQDVLGTALEFAEAYAALKVREAFEGDAACFEINELRRQVGELREERDGLQLQLNNYQSACRDLSVTQVMEVFSRYERAESALAEARNKALDEAAAKARSYQGSIVGLCWAEFADILLALKDKS